MVSPVSYARKVGLFTGTMMVIGGIIGSGIFRSPQTVAQRVHSPGLILTVWVLGGIIALAGAFVYAELGARFPKAGGQYVYLRDAIGSLPAFLYGWALLLMIAPGAIAAVAITFADYLIALAGIDVSWRLPLVTFAIVFITGINLFGVQRGAVTQNIFTVLKLLAIAVLVVAGLLAVGGGMPTETATVVTTSPLTAIGAALVPVLFAYGGWQQTNFVAEEIIAPERNLPRALILGVIGVVLAYVLANVAYLAALGAGGLAASDAPAADAMQQMLGPIGKSLISAGIVVSTFGFLSVVILVTPRVLQAMAADGLFLPVFARLHPRYRTPWAAILLLGVWSLILALRGAYGPLLDYVVFADWIFFALTGVTLFIYRRRDRNASDAAHTGFRTPAYPLVAGVFVLAGLYVVAGSITSNPANALRGALLLGAGVPVYMFWERRRGNVRRKTVGG